MYGISSMPTLYPLSLEQYLPSSPPNLYPPSHCHPSSFANQWAAPPVPKILPIPVRKLPFPVPLSELEAELVPPEVSNTPNTFFTGIASARLRRTGGGGNMADVVAVKYNSKYFRLANVDLRSITCRTWEFINYYEPPCV